MARVLATRHGNGRGNGRCIFGSSAERCAFSRTGRGDRCGQQAICNDRPDARSSASGEKVSTGKLALRDALAEKFQFIGHALPPDPDKSHDFNDRLVLKAMVEAMIGAEAPLRDDILARRVARAHGWFRTCSKIRRRVELPSRDDDRTSESSGTFVRKKGTVVNFPDCRAPFDLAGRQTVADIPLAEPAAFVLSEKDAFDQPDPAPDVARLPGPERPAASSRMGPEEAIGRARAHLASVMFRRIDVFFPA